MNTNSTKEILEQLSSKISEEEMILSGLQGLIASEITIKRHEAGLSQKEFADMMGVSQGLVSKWEAGDNNFTLSTLVKISMALNIKMQVPFVLDKPNVYNSKDGIISFPGSNYWSTKSSENCTFRELEESEELKEM